MVHRNNLFEKFDTQVSSQIYNKLLVKYKYELLFFNNQLHDQIRANLKRS